MKTLEILKTIKEHLQASDIDEAGREAEMILSHCIGTDRVYLYRDNPLLSEETAAKIHACVRRRSEREDCVPSICEDKTASFLTYI